MSTPLHEAVEEGSLQKIKKLLEEGHQVTTIDDFGLTPIHVAAEQGKEEIFKFFLTKLPESTLLALRDENSATLLHYAVLSNSRILCELLLEKSPSLKNESDSTKALPSHYACKHGYSDLLSILTDPENINSVDQHGWSPLHYASSNNHRECLRWLLENGADKSLKDKMGRTAKQIAKQRDFVLLLELFD
eukprot:TRINITY_DN4626_c0_g1_i1.p1 TRINITY_DN4626_c0_g1~~TRINITY_DN4626_c0_g1_i1.p1  ORF type:complete len:190 (+),score=28.46 TRINITY_DN4626_c0_g1_i1:44-613(+)